MFVARDVAGNVGYDSDVMEKQESELMESELDARQAQGEGLVFLLGLARSGTTLLNTLVNQHPRVALMKECAIAALPPWAFWLHPRGNLFKRLDLYNERLELHDLLELKAARGRAGKRTVCVWIYRTYAHRQDADVGGEKCPQYIGFADRLMRLFPRARFIVILREIHDVCAGFQRLAAKVRTLRQPGALASLLHYQELTYRFLTEHATNPRVMAIRYERLVADPEATMREVAGFLGVAFDPEMCVLPNGESSSKSNKHFLKWGNTLSETIAAPKHRDDPLPAGFKAKIDRYKVRWRQRFPDRVTGLAQESGSGLPPSKKELLLDRARAEINRVFNRMMLAFFYLSPLTLLRWYRRRRPLSFHRAGLQTAPDPAEEQRGSRSTNGV